MQTTLRTLSKRITTTTLRSFQTSTTSLNSSSCCPSCSNPLGSSNTSPLCPSCKSLVPPPPSSITHFNLLSQTQTQGGSGESFPKYSIDLKQLKKQFLNLQQKVHPDRYSEAGNGNGNGNEKENWAKLWSSRVNQAWKTLSNDRERAEYLLSLYDVTIGESDPVTDPELLMSIMETRELLEEAKTLDQVEQIRSQNSQQTREAIELLKKAFDETFPPDLELARNLVIQLKYLDNVETVCREWNGPK
ncbi:hypothetical protein JCM3765_000966 [Sporobolomyces pararoseus]